MPNCLAVCLMGPTASGKTEVAVQLAEKFAFDIVSVDSALVYRGLNIGTAKPDSKVLARAPHRLIDIREPEETYSAGTFVRDAHEQIDAIHAEGRIPLLVGGTMLYFRSLMGGIADLPEADPAIRAAIDAEAQASGWPKMHAALAEIDPETAARIKPRDRQRIQRALEVHRISGRTLSDWHSQETETRSDLKFVKIALVPGSRAELHRRINERFEILLRQAFIEEVAALRDRAGLTADKPSMRSVGYRQLWAHLDGEYDIATATAKGQAATRQLAKRQLTWLRSEPELFEVDPLEANATGAISAFLAETGNKYGVVGLTGLC